MEEILASIRRIIAGLRGRAGQPKPPPLSRCARRRPPRCPPPAILAGRTAATASKLSAMHDEGSRQK